MKPQTLLRSRERNRCNNMNQMDLADEVRTFPQLQMPVPQSSGDKTFPRVPKLSSKLTSVRFPRMLMTGKLSSSSSSTQSYPCSNNTEVQIPNFFSNLKLESLPRAPSPLKSSCLSQSSEPKHFSVINLWSNQDLPLNLGNFEVASNSAFDGSETPFQFLVYRGTTLSSTFEFAAYKKDNFEHWRNVRGVIRELEEYLKTQNIKIAVVNGARINEISSLHSVAGIYKEDIISCITHCSSGLTLLLSDRDEIHVQIKFLAATLIQRTFRNFLCRTCFAQQRLFGNCAVLIQRAVRRFMACKCVRAKLKNSRALTNSRWNSNVDKLKKSWQKLSAADPLAQSLPFSRNCEISTMNETISNPAMLSRASDRLLIFVPSICSAEHVRLSMDRFKSIQNIHIACLYHLIDPHVHILYISPLHLTREEVKHHEQFLSDSGVYRCPSGIKRLNFIVPEMIDKLPSHLPISQLLWCSSLALKKIRTFIKQIPNAIIIPSSLSWVEKRLSSYLHVPLLSPDPTVANTIKSRSFVKQIFIEAGLSTPIGARDILSSTDFYVKLSSLITSHIEVRRWVFKLNEDLNNGGFAYLDVDRLSVTAALRADFASHVGGCDDQSTGWHCKQVQLEVRKTVMLSLCAELPSKAVICDRSRHGSWDQFEKRFGLCGMVIDAGCTRGTECLLGLCFIDPNGAVRAAPGVTAILDKNYQVQGYFGPQTGVPMEVLDDATSSVARLLYERWGVIGYVAVEYELHCSRDVSRLKATGIMLGLSPPFLGTGSAAALGGALGPGMILPRSLIPSRESLLGKSFVYIPLAHYELLGPCRGDSFSKQCKASRVVFDRESRTGTLFFPVDALVGGSVSTLSISSSPAKALDTAIHALHFVMSQFGRVTVGDRRGMCSSYLLSSVLSTLREIKRKGSRKNQDLCSL